MNLHKSSLLKAEKIYILTNFLFLYFNIIISFCFIYLLLDFFHLGTIVNPFFLNNGQSLLVEKIISTLQLSATALFFDEAGAITVYGWSEVLALIEGTIGFLIPPLIMAMLLPPDAANFERTRPRLSKLLRRAFFVPLGALFVALGLKSFLVPNHIIDGGIVGISIIFSYLTGLKLEFYLFILNLPFLYLGYKKIGKRFVLTTLIGICILSLCTLYLDNAPVPVNNLFLASILGGILLGIGVGMVIRYGGSLDGTEILGILINKATKYSIGKIVMVINCFIFFSAGFVFGWYNALYSVLTYIIASKMIDVTIEGFHN